MRLEPATKKPRVMQLESEEGLARRVLFAVLPRVSKVVRSVDTVRRDIVPAIFHRMLWLNSSACLFWDMWKIN